MFRLTRKEFFAAIAGLIASPFVAKAAPVAVATTVLPIDVPPVEVTGLAADGAFIGETFAECRGIYSPYSFSIIGDQPPVIKEEVRDRFLSQIRPSPSWREVRYETGGEQ